MNSTGFDTFAIDKKIHVHGKARSRKSTLRKEQASEQELQLRRLTALTSPMRHPKRPNSPKVVLATAEQG
jgi:hypothetical protein